MLPPLAVAVHLQDGPDDCAQACAQMVIRFLTGGLRQ
jgi:hypothetical protein